MPFTRKTARKAGKKSGEARKPQKAPLTEGLNVAASVIGVSVETLQSARRAGCPGFMPGNRFDVGRIEDWLLEHGDTIDVGEALNGIRRRHVLARITSVRIEHDELAAKYEHAAVVAEACRRCSAASATVAKEMLSDPIRDLYVRETTTGFRRIERAMASKTANRTPSALEIKEPSEGSNLDDLRAVLLSWKTKLVELRNAVNNGEMVESRKVGEMIDDALNKAISMARKHLDAGAWNSLCVATKEKFARVLAEPYDPTPKETTK